MKYYVAERVNGEILLYHGINHKKGWTKNHTETEEIDPEIYFDRKSQAERFIEMEEASASNFLFRDSGITRTYEIVKFEQRKALLRETRRAAR